MDKFVCEMHAHTSNTSRCAHIYAKDLIEDYVKAGYDGIVITDHMNLSTFEIFKGKDTSWNDKIDCLLKGYREAVRTANGRIKVFLGIEIRFKSPCSIDVNDYLVYGVTEDFLYNNADIDCLNIREFSELAHKNGMAVFQAHPFRTGMRIINPKYLDGVEVYNACVRHNSRNKIANMWADLHSLLKTSGSDYHEHEDTARGGLIFDREIADNEDLVDALLHSSPELIRR